MVDTNKNTEYLCITIKDIPVVIATEFVQEVHETALITRVPGCPDFILGMINVRGNIIPVLDLWGIREKVTHVKKVVILKSTEGSVGLLISALVDLMTFAEKDTAEAVPEQLRPWEDFFSCRGTGEKRHYLMRADELIAATLPKHARQAAV